MAEVAGADEKGALETMVQRLLEMTRDGRLEWRPVDPPAPADSTSQDGQLTMAFRARYRNRCLQIGQIRRRALLLFGGEPKFHQVARLQILDEEGRVLWNFPSTSLEEELLRAAAYQAADVKGLVEAILSER